MAIIIGSATTVLFDASCVISANWSYNPNTQRLYCLGSTDIYKSVNKPTQTVSLTLYSPGPGAELTVSKTCDNAGGNMSISIIPGATCGGDIDGVSGDDWYVTSYNYSKEDNSTPAQESWSFTRWLALDEGTPPIIMRGISEGQRSSSSSETGVVLEDTVRFSNGSVSAGGFGKGYNMESGRCISIVSGSSSSTFNGQGNASVPYTPLYISA